MSLQLMQYVVVKLAASVLFLKEGHRKTDFPELDWFEKDD